MSYYVYILECSDNTFYAGITTDIDRRLLEHNSEKAGGAKYTRARQPVKLVYSAKFLNRSEATKKEMSIKKLSQQEKESLIAGQ